MEHEKQLLSPMQRHGRSLGAVLVGVGAVAACVGLWSTNRPALNVAPGGVLVLTFGLVMTALCGASVWWALLMLAGVRQRWSSVLLAWCGGTPAKYLPGKVGSVVARAALLGEPHAMHAATATAEVLLTLAVGGLVALAIPLEHAGSSTFIAGIGVGVASVILVWWARRRFGPASPAAVGVIPWVVAIAAPAVGWLAQGVALGGAVAAVGGPVSVRGLSMCCGIAGAAAIAGVLSPTPAGLGPRDVVLGLLMVALIDEDTGRATAAVFSWRVASVAIEVSLAGVAGLGSRWRASSGGEHVHTADPADDGAQP